MCFSPRPNKSNLTTPNPPYLPTGCSISNISKSPWGTNQGDDARIDTGWRWENLHTCTPHETHITLECVTLANSYHIYAVGSTLGPEQGSMNSVCVCVCVCVCARVRARTNICAYVPCVMYRLVINMGEKLLFSCKCCPVETDGHFVRFCCLNHQVLLKGR